MRLIGWILPALVMFTAVGCNLGGKPGEIPGPGSIFGSNPWGSGGGTSIPVSHSGSGHTSCPTVGPIATGPSDWSVSNPRHWKYIVIHHSATANGCAASIDAAHKKNGWKGLGYDFVINNGTGRPDGEIEVGFRWRQQIEGAHCKTPGNEYNEYGIGICLVGDFTSHMPSRSQLASLHTLVYYMMDKYHIPAANVIGHREAPGTHTECPGDTLINYIRTDFRPGLSRR